MEAHEAAAAVWAKSSGVHAWASLPMHMQDSLKVAEFLYDHWLSEHVKTRWAEALPESTMRRIAIFLASVHDVGKAAPAFAAQHEGLAQRAREAGLPSHTRDELKDERAAMPHSAIGEWALNDWLQNRHGVPKRAARGLASVVGAHHGRPVRRSDWNVPNDYRHGTGDESWAAVRNHLLETMSRLSGFDEVLEWEPNLELPLPILVELCGFVIVADWVASNTGLFPLRNWDEDGRPDPDPTARAAFGWGELAMPPPWQPPEPAQIIDELFTQRFDLPSGAKPHPTQRVAVELARTVDVGMMCIETVTGGGKTEAALTVAEILAARQGSQGIMVALPTQATTNAMFQRVTDWIAKLPKPPAELGAWAITLGHGKALLNSTYAELAEAVRAFDRLLDKGEQTGTIYDGDPSTRAVVHPWFLGSKRRLLANFTVVTIDQLLMAALQRKHLMLAHVALSGKIVIIDEAHASDAFMNVYLDSILSWLGAYRVPVIVLSATLTAERRRQMLSAYAPHRSDEIQGMEFDPKAYPLITVLPQGDGPVIANHIEQNPADNKTVTWAWHPTDLAALVTSVQAAIAEGGCALVVRNTVADAQATAEALAEVGLPVELNHAGFLAIDRAANDARLNVLYGNRKDGRRPAQAVVVATQVVEQSLDVDFDILFTDLAPIDLLLQRMGRLHRHRRPRPAHLKQATVHVLADDHGPDVPPTATSGSEAVYGAYLLIRSAAALVDHGPTIVQPADVSPLVTTALGNTEVVPSLWQEALDEARVTWDKQLKEQIEKASTWCVSPWKGDKDRRRSLGEWLAVANEHDIQMGATVRDTQPTLEVIVLPTTPDGAAAIRPPWTSANPDLVDVIDTSSLPSDEVAREIASWSVRLPSRLTRWPKQLDAMIAAISQNPATRRWAWGRHRLLKGELFLPMKQEFEGSTSLTTQILVNGDSYLLRYSPERGLEVSQE